MTYLYRFLVTGTLALTLAGCGGSDKPPTGPFDEVPLGQQIESDGLENPVHVVRDEFGILHISADSVADAAFAQGYLTAHDRLPQIDILRRFGAGTVAELFGALDADVVETDLEMRMHRMKPLAQQSYDELVASSDPRDQQIVDLLNRYADGVNAFNAELVAGTYQLDPALQVTFDPARFEPWSPVDCLVLGRFQAFALSWTTPLLLDISDIYQRATETFDEAVAPGMPGHDADRYARRGASADLMRIAPIGKTPTVDGFPGVSTESSAAAATAASRGTRPRPPRALFDNARRFFRAKGWPSPHAFMNMKAGSNNWVVGPSLTGGKAMLAGDQHLSMPNPSIFYPIHIRVKDQFDIQGITFPGIPGIVLGHNGKVAWSATVAFHQVNDIYLETIVPCDGGGDCVSFKGEQVPVETWTEEIKIGALGTITETKTVTYERVPHHGPIIPTIADRQLVPRATDQAFSVKYTGQQPSFEIRATFGLAFAEDVEDARAALSNFTYGAQNWVIIDSQGSIGWTTIAKVPLRSPAAYTWNAETNPGGLAPFLVLPNDGSAEWEGFMDERYVPHAVNPPEGLLATANSDPTGASFDGDAFDTTVVDERPLFVGATYAPGLRTERIVNLLREKADAGPITLEDMAEIQHDTQSTFGERMQPGLLAALAKLDTPSPDIEAWTAGLEAARVQRLRGATTRLAAWTLATPPAVADDASSAEIDDSVATTIFNVWVHYFLGRSLGDEMAELEWDVYDVNENLSCRIMLALLDEPTSLRSGLSAETNQPILCDDMATEGVVESCDLLALQALDQALTWLEGSEAYASADMSTWRWGQMHRLTLEPLFPEDALNVPPPAAQESNPLWRGGYPRAGDTFVINRADSGWNDLEFDASSDGAAQRFLAEVEPGGQIRARMSLPGGTVYDRESPHYRDLMDEYYIQDRHFDLPYTTEQIINAGEDRWLFTAR